MTVVLRAPRHVGPDFYPRARGSCTLNWDMRIKPFHMDALLGLALGLGIRLGVRLRIRARGLALGRVLKLAAAGTGLCGPTRVVP